MTAAISSVFDHLVLAGEPGVDANPWQHRRNWRAPPPRDGERAVRDV